MGTLLCAHANEIYVANYITPDKRSTVENRGVSPRLPDPTSITCYISSPLMNAMEKYFVFHTTQFLGDVQGYPDCIDLGNGYR